MKLYQVKRSLLSLLAFAPLMAMAQTPGAGLIGTAHDFASATGNGIPHDAAADSAGPFPGVGLCTFCHTPHKALSTQLLWNHTLSSNTFKWDVATTTAGTNFPQIAGGTYKGPTAKCLSCHDGSVAVGDIAWYKETAWNTGTPLATFKMGDNDGTGATTSQFVVGSLGNMAGNHPVAMPYSFNQQASTYNTAIGGSALVLTEWQADPTASSSAHIRLFNDDGAGNITAGAVAGKTGIECSSCHDPHNKATVDGWFLRGKAQGSTQADGYICLQCHIK